MKRLIVVFLIASLISGCDKLTDIVSPVVPQSLNASTLVPQSQNDTESSQFSPIPAESVEPLKSPNTHDNVRWYSKYSTHIIVAVSIVTIALLAYLGIREHNKALAYKKDLDVATTDKTVQYRPQKAFGDSVIAEFTEAIPEISQPADNGMQELINVKAEQENVIRNLKSELDNVNTSLEEQKKQFENQMALARETWDENARLKQQLESQQKFQQEINELQKQINEFKATNSELLAEKDKAVQLADEMTKQRDKEKSLKLGLSISLDSTKFQLQTEQQKVINTNKLFNNLQFNFNNVSSKLLMANTEKEKMQIEIDNIKGQLSRLEKLASEGGVKVPKFY